MSDDPIIHNQTPEDTRSTADSCLLGLGLLAAAAVAGLWLSAFIAWYLS